MRMGIVYTLLVLSVNSATCAEADVRWASIPPDTVVSANLVRNNKWYVLSASELSAVRELIAKKPWSAPEGSLPVLEPMPNRFVLWGQAADRLSVVDVIDVDDAIGLLYSTRKGEYYETANSKQREPLVRLMERISKGAEQPILTTTKEPTEERRTPEEKEKDARDAERPKAQRRVKKALAAGEAPANDNRAPVVKPVKSVDGRVGEQLRIEADAIDPDSDQLEYKWTCVDPPELVIPEMLAKNCILVFVPKLARKYVFKVTVTDVHGASVSAQAVVSVKEALKPELPAPQADPLK